MNFMDIPLPDKIPNSKLEGSALATAIQFIDEMIALRFLCFPHPSITVVNTFPLFLSPKPGQRGQYRTIADGKVEVKMKYAWRTLVI